MKKLLLIISIIAALIISAGCIGNSSDTNVPDKIIGSWIAENHTNSQGVHYTKIVYNFSADYTMSKIFHIDDGKEIHSKGLWIKNDDGNYTAYYAAFTFELDPTGDKAVINSEMLNIKDMTVVRSDGNSGFIGSWKNKEPYNFNTGASYIQLSPSADGTGKAAYLDENGSPDVPLKFTWVELGQNMFVLSFSQPLELYIDESGKLCDNFGVSYTLMYYIW
ncbi:MAG: hypothetical protein Q4Q53_07840 [Methanocorpusculum sp.]|nr:hypothetical protein [Methanocorpusculum sp.]